MYYDSIIFLQITNITFSKYACSAINKIESIAIIAQRASASRIPPFANLLVYQFL